MWCKKIRQKQKKPCIHWTVLWTLLFLFCPQFHHRRSEFIFAFIPPSVALTGRQTDGRYWEVRGHHTVSKKLQFCFVCPGLFCNKLSLKWPHKIKILFSWHSETSQDSVVDKSDTTSYIFAEGDEWGQQIWHCPLSLPHRNVDKEDGGKRRRWMEKLSETEASLEIEQEGWVKFSQTG